MKFVAVHLGAGFHSPLRKFEYKRLSEEAIDAAFNLNPSMENWSLEAVTTAISFLESSPSVNCGIGSNLTRDGTVECDASIYFKESYFGSVGAVPKCINPIRIAYWLVSDQIDATLSKEKSPLVLPLMLVGEGALDYGKEKGLTQASPESLISNRSWKEYKKYKGILESQPAFISQPASNFQDTVGAIAIDQFTATGVSSGGIALKRRGRVGEAAIHGAGCWISTKTIICDDSEEIITFGISVSGTGEQIIQNAFARNCLERLEPEEGLESQLGLILKEFLMVPRVTDICSRNIGFILTKTTSSALNLVELWYAHSTPSFAFAFKSHTSSFRFLISRLDPGDKFKIGCHSCRF